MAQHTPGLSPPQANAIATKLWVRDNKDKNLEQHIQSALNNSWTDGCILFITLFSEQGFVEVVSWLDEVRPLLYCTPLLSVLSRTHLLVNNVPAVATKPWNTQQVCSGNIHCKNVVQVHSEPNAMALLVYTADNLLKKIFVQIEQ